MVYVLSHGWPNYGIRSARSIYAARKRTCIRLREFLRLRAFSNTDCFLSHKQISNDVRGMRFRGYFVTLFVYELIQIVM